MKSQRTIPLLLIAIQLYGSVLARSLHHADDLDDASADDDLERRSVYAKEVNPVRPASRPKVRRVLSDHSAADKEAHVDVAPVKRALPPTVPPKKPPKTFGGTLSKRKPADELANYVDVARQQAVRKSRRNRVAKDIDHARAAKDDRIIGAPRRFASDDLGDDYIIRVPTFPSDYFEDDRAVRDDLEDDYIIKVPKRPSDDCGDDCIIRVSKFASVDFEDDQAAKYDLEDDYIIRVPKRPSDDFEDSVNGNPPPIFARSGNNVMSRSHNYGRRFIAEKEGDDEWILLNKHDPLKEILGQ